jgi:hypothetical protein
VLDFLTLEKAQAAIHAIRDTGVDQRVLDRARLRVAAVENRDFAARRTGADQRLDFFDDPAGFL